MTVVDLFARIGLKTDEGKAKSFNKQMKAVKIGMVAAATAATVFALAIKKITSEAFDASAAFAQFESETGASAQELQKWQAVANETNNSAEAVASSIKNIVANQEKIKLGQGDISGFQMLGIDPNQDPFQILEELRTKTAGLSAGMKKNILSQMGVSNELIQVLELSNEQFDEMSSRAFVLPPSAIASMNKARGATQVLSNALKYLKGIIAAELAPTIEKNIKAILKWIKVNEKGIILTIKTAFKWLRRFTGAIINSATMIGKIISKTISWKGALIGVIGAFALLNATLITSPIGLIIAGIVLLVAVLDDLYVYSQGGESLFGNMMARFPDIEKKLKGFMTFLKNATGLIKALFGGDQADVNAFIEKMGTAGKVIVGLFEGIKQSFNLAWTAIKVITRSVTDLIRMMFELGKAIGGKQKWGETFKIIDKINKESGKKSLLDISNLVGSIKSSAKTFTTSNKVNINVQTTADAQGTANAIIGPLQAALEETSAQRSFDE